MAQQPQLLRLRRPRRPGRRRHAVGAAEGASAARAARSNYETQTGYFFIFFGVNALLRTLKHVPIPPVAVTRQVELDAKPLTAIAANA